MFMSQSIIVFAIEKKMFSSFYTTTYAIWIRFNILKNINAASMNYTACEVSRAVSGLILNQRNNTLEYQESYSKKIIHI